VRGASLEPLGSAKKVSISNSVQQDATLAVDCGEAGTTPTPV
jgi:hypothetical protein